MNERTKILYGWTFAQWAEVAAYCKRFGDLPMPTIENAGRLYKTWKMNRIDEPGEHRIIEVAHEMDWLYATKIFESAIVNSRRWSLP